MRRTSTRLVKTALSALHYSGFGKLIAPLTSGQGVIFTLHQVLPEARRDFDPNGILRVTPGFLETVIRQVRAQGFETVSLDDAVASLTGVKTLDRPFACFTFDDGYRDNLTFAYPILQRHQVPFTIYVPTDYPDGRGELWWLALEDVVRVSPRITVELRGALQTLPCRTVAEKQSAFDAIYWWLRALPEDRAREVIRELATGVGIDLAQQCRDLIMTWDELRSLSRDPLATIGAHTISHYAAAKLATDFVRSEISGSIARIEAELGRPCRHFSFPYGCQSSATQRDFEIAASLGVASAVTTRKGLIHGGARARLTALPRVSLNGDYQRRHYIDVLLTGAPFAFLDLLRRRRTVAA